VDNGVMDFKYTPYKFAVLTLVARSFILVY